MSRKLEKRTDEVMYHSRRGLSPGAIASTLGIDPETVVQWLCIAVGMDLTWGTVIFLSIPRPIRETYSTAANAVGRDAPAIRRWLGLKAPDVTASELPVFLAFEGRLRVDTYRLIARLEEILHEAIRQTLAEKLALTEEGWWRQGIPAKIRSACHARREEDSQPSEHPYNYTHFIELKEIFDSKWAVLCEVLSPTAKADKKQFMEGWRGVNNIRNRVMHASRWSPPTEDDFQELRDFMTLLAGEKK